MQPVNRASIGCYPVAGYILPERTGPCNTPNHLMQALIDADIVAYRCAAVNENVDEGIARWQADELVTRILADTNATSQHLFLSGNNNFRYALFPDYKKHRRDKPKPRHLEAVREHLVLNWNADIVDGYEADDALGMEQMQKAVQTVICSIDKDLLQIPGKHYNFVKQQLVEISELEGWYNFYIQLLTGDAADGIPGCPGIGKVKAPRILGECKTPWEMFSSVAKQYNMAGQSYEFMLLNAQLLYIWRKENDCYIPPATEPPSSYSEFMKVSSLALTADQPSLTPSGGLLMGATTQNQILKQDSI